MIGLLWFAQHPIVSRSDGHGGTITYYYYDRITWIAGTLALAWLTWLLVSRYRRLRGLRRRPRRVNQKLLKRTIKFKSELSAQYLLPGFSRRIHAVGIGTLAGADEYCIQVFINDENEELWQGAAGATLPNNYRGVPLVLIEMPAAEFLSAPDPDLAATPPFSKGIRGRQEVIIGGISGAHANLTGQSGTIGYFCTRKSRFSRRQEVHLFSNTHVFADLRKPTVDKGDLIMQPSPGEASSTRPIGALVNFSPINFDDVNKPNQIDAAIAKLWAVQQHQPLIPMIGAVKGHVEKKHVGIGEPARKFGRTTGYTEGRVCSIYLDIWVRYDRTGQSAFFQDQFLIEPDSPRFARFVSGGDSGSLVVDANQHAIGLIFAGMSEAPKAPQALPSIESILGANPDPTEPRRIESYGVANPISDVLDRLKIDLLV